MTYRPDIDMCSQLRHAADLEADELVRFKLRKAESDLQDAMRAFQFTATGANLTVLNGAWSSSIRTLDKAGGQAHLHRGS